MWRGVVLCQNAKPECRSAEASTLARCREAMVLGILPFGVLYAGVWGGGAVKL